MYTKEYLETYNGKIVGVELWSDQGCVIYGMLWTGRNGFLISDMTEITCDSYSLSISEFNKRTYVNSLKYADIKLFSTAYQNIDRRVVEDIEKAAVHLKQSMQVLGYTGLANAVVDTTKYPHKCNYCGSQSYNGFGPMDIECSNQGCRFYKP